MVEKSIIDQLLQSDEPAIKLKTYLRLLDFEHNNQEVKKLTSNIKETSPIIVNLFTYLPKSDEEKNVHVYTKWQGAHWILSILADIGYPAGDEILKPSINQVLKWLVGGKKRPIINGLRRFCASQEGNGLYSALRLGFYDERCDVLVERLVQYQWEDGGWNCDKKPTVKNSSYHESLLPLRGLFQFQKRKPENAVKNAIEKATELFLKRKLFWKSSDGEVINKKWLLLRYPSYWHYDILSILKVLAETGKIQDKRCNDGLDLLEAKRLPEGGFPKEDRFCQTANAETRYFTPGDWQSVNKKKINEWVTIDALYILKEAKRIDLEY
ncbi:MAG: hypothetical protein ACTSSB_09550 [Candidatus Heimdallarchaeota archaeon]